MPLYQFTVLTPGGTAEQGEEIAASPSELTDTLKRRGFLVQEIRIKRVPSRLFRKTVRVVDFLLFNQEFTALLRAGLTLPESLALVAERPENPAFSGVLKRILEQVRNGSALSQACSAHPEIFDGLYLAALSTGEKTGGLVDALTRYLSYLRRRAALNKKLSQALTYPLFLLVALAVILAVLFAFVLPRFVAMYADFDAALPLPTRLLITFVENVPFILPVVLALAGAIGFGLRRWLGTDHGRMAFDRTKERLPYFGPLHRLALQAQLSRSLSTLLAGGTVLLDALYTVADSLPNRAYGVRLGLATRQVAEGTSLAAALKAQDLMPAMAVRMIEVGESSGGLEAMLAEVAQYYEDILENHLSRVMSLVEPALMLLMGILVGGIIIVMYLPIFHMADIIK
jgi:type IV pilus assembly protein PilC